MKLFCIATTIVVLIAGCASESQITQPSPVATDTYVLHNTNSVTPGNRTSKPPRLSVGVGYSDTQLILPWFLNDIIDLINYR
jgi:hypothetical protein